MPMEDPIVPTGMPPVIVPTADCLLQALAADGDQRARVVTWGRDFIANGQLSARDRLRLKAAGLPELGPGR